MENIKTASIFRACPEYTERYIPEEENPFRSKFLMDRDRLLLSKEYRRLSGKTQVFVSGFDDNMRTRLTHTMEVAQIANIIVGTAPRETDRINEHPYGNNAHEVIICGRWKSGRMR